MGEIANPIAGVGELPTFTIYDHGVYNDDPTNSRGEAWHRSNFTDSEMETLREEMAARNRAIEQEREALNKQMEDDEAILHGEETTLQGEEDAEFTEDEAGVIGLVLGFTTLLAIAATLGAIGYSEAEVANIANEIAKLPPDTAVKITPPGANHTIVKVVPGGVIPALRRRRRRRPLGFM